MMTVSYTAKKKQRPATGLRISGSQSRAKRPKESEQPSKDLLPLRKNSPMPLASSGGPKCDKTSSSTVALVTCAKSITSLLHFR